MLIFTALGVCPQHYIYNPYERTCLRLVEEGLKWSAAYDVCRNAGEYLATFSTAASSRWLRSTAKDLADKNPGDAC